MKRVASEVSASKAANRTPLTVRAPPAISSGTRGPRLPTSRPASGAHRKVGTAIGSIHSPACRALSPRTFCRYSVDRNRKPPSAAKALTAMTVAPLNGAERKKRRSMRGSARRGSYRRRPSRAASASAANGSTAVNPAFGASMIAYVREPNSTMTISWPSGSGRRAFGARDSGTKRRVRSRAARPTGRLTQKIERQPTDSTSRPPTSGPAAMDMPTTAPQTPIARARSRGSVKVLVMIDMATGLSMEPPTAWIIRKTTREDRSGASEHSSEPRVKTTRPVMKTRLRPIRSAVEPASISSAASTRV